METKLGKIHASKTLHRVSGYDTRAGNVESRDEEKEEADRPLANSLVFLKTKNPFIKCLHDLKPFLGF